MSPPSPTSNGTSPIRDNDATRSFLERERASLEAIGVLEESKTQESLSKDVAGLLINSQPGSVESVESEPQIDNRMEIDYSTRQESQKIAEWRKNRAEAIARREEESDRQRQESRKRAQSELAAFLSDYSRKTEERRAQPVDTSAYMTEFDGKREHRPQQNRVDWVAVQRLVKGLPQPGTVNADRFLQIVNNMAAQQQNL